MNSNANVLFIDANICIEMTSNWKFTEHLNELWEWIIIILFEWKMEKKFPFNMHTRILIGATHVAFIIDWTNNQNENDHQEHTLGSI